MGREIPELPKGWTPPSVRTEEIREYRFQLITPMFGGGVTAGVNDPSFPIRPTAIRGQLQFWWRATAGAACESPEALRAAQSEIWGDTSRASRVRVRVDEVKACEPSPCASIEWNPRARQGQGGWRIEWLEPFNGRDSALPYALFPFQGELPPPNRNETSKKPPAHCIRNVTFRLTVICPKNIDFAKQIEPAVWAWANFGGLGGRTRRGCGAIFCEDLGPRDFDEFREMWSRHMAESFPAREWPTLGERPLLKIDEKSSDPVAVWNQIVGAFRDFRQGVDFGRNSGQQPGRPGRSRYPEPETIRRVTGKRTSRHSRMPDIPDDAFPRAELGLPIVFHFQQGGQRDSRDRDPSDTVLYPGNDAEGAQRERMASPLILKPLGLRSGSAIRAIPMILRLKTPVLEWVDLRQGNRSLSLPWTTVIRDARLASYLRSPLGGSASGSAIEAFLAFARARHGFTEATR